MKIRLDLLSISKMAEDFDCWQQGVLTARSLSDFRWPSFQVLCF